METSEWELRRVCKSLETAKGAGTSMVSLTVAANGQLPNKLLIDELSKASNIKSRLNRHSVESAIRSCIERVKTYKKVPANGLCIFCGEALTDDGKLRQIMISFEPYKPLLDNMYMCDNKFHIEPLKRLLVGGQRFGFIIIDGHGCLCGVLCGSEKTIRGEFTVSLPKKHSRGGQSSVRFAHLHDEACHNYVTKARAFIERAFIENNVPNVSSIIMAGSANYKVKVSEILDTRLTKIIHPTFLDIQYGGHTGFDEAIGLAKNIIGDVNLVREKAIVSTFMQKICKAENSTLAVYGKKDVTDCINEGAVDTVLIWENYDGTFINWLMENRTQLHIDIELVSDKTSEGAQFCKGFGGIGAILRYARPVQEVECEYVDDTESIV